MLAAYNTTLKNTLKKRRGLYTVTGKAIGFDDHAQIKKIRTKHSTVVTGSTFCFTPHLLEEEKGSGGSAVDIPVLHRLRIIRIEKLDKRPSASILPDLWGEDRAFEARTGRSILQNGEAFGWGDVATVTSTTTATASRHSSLARTF